MAKLCFAGSDAHLRTSPLKADAMQWALSVPDLVERAQAKLPSSTPSTRPNLPELFALQDRVVSPGPVAVGGEAANMAAGQICTRTSFGMVRPTTCLWPSVPTAKASAYGCVVKLRASKGMFCKSLVAPWPAAASSEDSSAFEVPRLSPDTSFAFCLEAEPEEEIDDPYYRREVVKRQLFAQVL